MIALYINGRAVAQTTEAALLDLDAELSALHARTGKRVDAYSTVTLEAAHARIVVEAAKARPVPRSKEVQVLLDVLENAALSGATVLIEGE